MKLNRRTFIGATAACTVFPTLGQAKTQTLTASHITKQLLPNGTQMAKMMGFNGSTPGPVLRVRQNEALSVNFENRLDEGSTVHWHGIRLPNGMDGVPNQTQDIVPPGATFKYRFKAPDAGTFWYHSHYISYEQVERGLYGPLIVEDPTPPDVDHDIVALIDDWLVTKTGALDEEFGNRHDLSHAGRIGNFARAILSQNTVRTGDRIRLRLINAATARVFPLTLFGLDGRIVALDGIALARPMALGSITLAPAQRVDVIADVISDPQIAFETRGGQYLLGALTVDGTNTTRSGRPIQALAPAHLPLPDLKKATQLTLNMQGGAMGSRHGGDDLWAFNDMSGLGRIPFGSFKRGETAVIDLVNATSFPHGMHLHGHHFSELTPDGQIGPFRDTTLVQPGQSRKIACVFDNPGRWMFHCHMLGHQEAGMKTWVAVG